MSVTDKIIHHVKGLPESVQTEILDFVEFLETRTEKGKQEEQSWSELSLTQAMRGMEDEPSPYSLDDIKETS